MTYETLEIKDEDGIAWLTLNRPHALNALSGKMAEELRDFIAGLRDDRKARVVIVRAAGRAFCSGLDLKEQMAGGSEAFGESVIGTLEAQRRINEVVLGIRRAPQPFIAAVKGATCGGGFAIALACDVRLAGQSARMNAAFIRVGVSACDMGLSYFLPRAVGSSLAFELMLTGRFINAERALRTGLVSEVHPDSELDTAARRLAREMLETSPLGLKLTKDCLWASIDAASLEQALAMEERNQTLCVKAGLLKEGARAFVEKRKPRFAERA